jgi:hypothetical protein
MAEARARPNHQRSNSGLESKLSNIVVLEDRTDESILYTVDTRHSCLLTSGPTRRITTRMESTHVTRLAEICSSRIDPACRSFDDTFPRFKNEMQQLPDALKTTDPRFLFDRNGRPGAIAAIRGALPGVERELFDAVMEDCECELAATREAFFQLVKACQAKLPSAGGAAQE